MTARISRALLERLLAEAAASPGHEVCGLLYGGKSDIQGALAAVNMSSHPADSFEIDPAALFAAIRAERAGGPCVIGHYHSHPRGSARPSPRDAAAALDSGRLWLILGADGASAWRALPGGPVEGAFEAVSLAISDECGGEAGCVP